ncbi:DUF3310 domain-containing protein [Staphylococcus pseudintermedius]|nr:DUF3310 domain-containing protein [Staphylococcus pseudintermedius]
MEIKELEIGDEVQIVRGVQRVRDEDDEKWVYEPCFEKGEVIDVYEKGSKASVDFKNGTCTVINADTEWYKIPTHERPAHYGNSDIDLIDYWCKRYTPEELRGAFKSHISKYVDRLGYKDDEVDELHKIVTYATRYEEHLKKVKA